MEEIHVINRVRMNFRYTRSIDNVDPSPSHIRNVEEKTVTTEAAASANSDPPSSRTTRMESNPDMITPRVASHPNHATLTPPATLVGIELNPGPFLGLSQLPNDLIIYLIRYFLSDRDAFRLIRSHQFFFQLLHHRYEMKSRVTWWACHFKTIERYLSPTVEQMLSEYWRANHYSFIIDTPQNRRFVLVKSKFYDRSGKQLHMELPYDQLIPIRHQDRTVQELKHSIGIIRLLLIQPNLCLSDKSKQILLRPSDTFSFIPPSVTQLSFHSEGGYNSFILTSFKQIEHLTNLHHLTLLWDEGAAKLFRSLSLAYVPKHLSTLILEGRFRINENDSFPASLEELQFRSSDSACKDGEWIGAISLPALKRLVIGTWALSVSSDFLPFLDELTLVGQLWDANQRFFDSCKQLQVLRDVRIVKGSNVIFPDTIHEMSIHLQTDDLIHFPCHLRMLNLEVVFPGRLPSNLILPESLIELTVTMKHSYYYFNSFENMSAFNRDGCLEHNARIPIDELAAPFHFLEDLMELRLPTTHLQRLHLPHPNSFVIPCDRLSQDILRIHEVYQQWLNSFQTDYRWAVDNHLITVYFPSIHPTTTAVKTIPPSARLVGIELNPGPINRSLLSSGPTTPIVTSSTSPNSTIRPQNLFKDGLHLIYSYLTQLDWFTSLKTCRSWLSASVTDPTRQLTFVVSLDEADIPILSNCRFIHLITRLEYPPFVPRFSPVYGLSSEKALLRLCQRLPRLRHISNYCLDHDLTVSFVSRIIWPKFLQTLSIHLCDGSCPTFFETIGSVSSLIELELLNVQVLEDISTRLIALTQLRRLTIRCPDMGFSTLSTDTHLRLMNACKSVHLPENLLYFSLNGGAFGVFFECLHDRATKLREINLDRFVFGSGDLRRLLTVAPHLTSARMVLPPQSYFMDEVKLLSEFHNLDSFYLILAVYGFAIDPEVVDAFIQSLAGCTQLSSLTLSPRLVGFGDFITVAESLQQLTHLDLTRGGYSLMDTLTTLQPFGKCLKILKVTLQMNSQSLHSRCLEPLGDFRVLEQLYLTTPSVLVESDFDQVHQYLIVDYNLPTLIYFQFTYGTQPDASVEISSSIQPIISRTDLMMRHLQRGRGGGSASAGTAGRGRRESSGDSINRDDNEQGHGLGRVQAQRRGGGGGGGRGVKTTKVIFIWDKAKVQPRRPTTVATHIHNIPSQASEPATSTSVAATPPNERLVGIELNPGPLANGSLECPGWPCPSAQTLFKDGLLIVYSYLTDREWMRALKTCRLWYQTASSSPSRQIDYFSLWTHPSVSALHPLSKGTRLAYHFPHLSTRSIDPSKPSLTPSHFISIVGRLPYLQSIDHLVFDHSVSVDIAPRQSINWPAGLNRMAFDFGSIAWPHLFSSICSISTLTSLTLFIGREFRQSFQPRKSFRPLVHLQELVLDQSSHSGDLLQLKTIPYIFIPPTLTSLTFHHTPFMKYLYKLGHLKHLKYLTSPLSHYRLASGDIPYLVKFVPRLESYQHFQLGSDAPNDFTLFTHLHTVGFRPYYPPSFPIPLTDLLSTMNCLSLSSTITNVELSINLQSNYPSILQHLPSTILGLVISVINSDDISESFQFLYSRLKRLTFSSPCTELLLDRVSQFLVLEELVWIVGENNHVQAIKEYFDSPFKIPSLTSLQIRDVHDRVYFIYEQRKGINCEHYRRASMNTMAVTVYASPESNQVDSEMSPSIPNEAMELPPAARLVGIEENPGPSTSPEATAAIPTAPSQLVAQSNESRMISCSWSKKLPQDVLFTIGGFMTSKEALVDSVAVCSEWRRMIYQMPSLHFDYGCKLLSSIGSRELATNQIFDSPTRHHCIALFLDGHGECSWEVPQANCSQLLELYFGTFWTSCSPKSTRTTRLYPPKLRTLEIRLNEAQAWSDYQREIEAIGSSASQLTNLDVKFHAKQIPGDALMAGEFFDCLAPSLVSLKFTVMHWKGRHDHRATAFGEYFAESGGQPYYQPVMSHLRAFPSLTNLELPKGVWNSRDLISYFSQDLNARMTASLHQLIWENPWGNDSIHLIGRMTSLTELILRYSPSEGFNNFEILVQLPHLRKLSLIGSVDIYSDKDAILDRLSHVVAPPEMTIFLTRCQSIQELALWNESRLRDTELRQLLVHLIHLRQLELRSCGVRSFACFDMSDVSSRAVVHPFPFALTSLTFTGSKFSAALEDIKFLFQWIHLQHIHISPAAPLYYYLDELVELGPLVSSVASTLRLIWPSLLTYQISSKLISRPSRPSETDEKEANNSWARAEDRHQVVDTAMPATAGPSSPTLDTDMESPPADRLVGIELNPGPISSLGDDLGGGSLSQPSHHLFRVARRSNWKLVSVVVSFISWLYRRIRATTAPASVTTANRSEHELARHLLSSPEAMTSISLQDCRLEFNCLHPQTLFNDALHHIYSYLTDKEWAICLQACRHWFHSSLSSNKRALTITMDSNRQLPFSLDYPFRSWITTLLGHPLSKKYVPIRHLYSTQPLQLSSFIQSCKFLPGLLSIENLRLVPLAKNTVDLSSDDYLTQIDQPWPKLLHTFKCDFVHVSYPWFMNSITQITSLTELKMFNPRCEIEVDLGGLIHLRKLSICSWNVSNGSVSDDEWKFIGLPQSISYLNLNHGQDGCFLKYITKSRPQLTGINFRSFNFKPGDAERLLAIAPNLTQCHVNVPVTDLDLNGLENLSALTSLTLRSLEWKVPPFVLDSLKLTLNKCIHLTHLNINRQDFLAQPSDWTLLQSHLPSLVSLEIVCSTTKPFADLAYLQPFQSQLKRLCLHVWIEVTIEFLQSCSIFTYLEEFEFDWVSKPTEENPLHQPQYDLIKQFLMMPRDYLS